MSLERLPVHHISQSIFPAERSHGTRRQRSDLGIARTTPALLGLFSLVTLWAENARDGGIWPRGAA